MGLQEPHDLDAGGARVNAVYGLRYVWLCAPVCCCSEPLIERDGKSRMISTNIHPALTICASHGRSQLLNLTHLE